MQAKEVINVVLARKLVKEAKMFILQNDLDMTLKAFVELAVIEKIERDKKNSSQALGGVEYSPILPLD